MVHRLARAILYQILLADIGHVICLIIFGEQVVKRLVFDRTAIFWNGVIPFLGIRKLRIDVENDPSERMLAMPYDLAKVIFRVRLQHIISTCAEPYRDLRSFVESLRLFFRKQTVGPNTTVDLDSFTGWRRTWQNPGFPARKFFAILKKNYNEQ